MSATTASRTTTIVYDGAVNGTQEIAAADNTSSPAMVELVALINGNTTITVPAGGSVPTAVTIVPPSDNTVPLTLKGVAGDTGVAIHPTDPTTIALASTAASFVITATGNVNVRLFWT